MVMIQICLVKQVNKETQVHFLVGGCLIQKSLYFQIFNSLNFFDCEDKILRKFLLTSQITTTGHMDVTQFKKYLSLDNFNFSILMIRRVLRVSEILQNNNQKIIAADSGHNVNLTCRAPNNNIFIVEWSRADLGVKHVAVFKDKELKEDDQHPLFKNRVDLQDKEMKDGDVSVILKNVTINDTGTYECCIVRETVSCDPICTIDLSVVDPPAQTGGDKQDGPVGLIVGLSVPAVVLVAAAVVFLIYRKQRNLQLKFSLFEMFPFFPADLSLLLFQLLRGDTEHSG
ncbi:uncharacterized protein LOC120724478 isoform X2 [Simochromis diagramma]|uniref:uncharacterized protein LOC120724478 isoform X2 n=1 Tax=Simochromis diagramma TaxID=43689 RepID=UPI001A7E20E0|nr:uncharacterized protein LOC120724478 isoform X2 [Simochromis diagramma]